MGFIYKLENMMNGKIYIGQSRNPDRPFDHFKRSHSNEHLRAAVLIYGRDAFVVKIICECYSQEDLDWAEQFFICEWYMSIDRRYGYNKVPGGNNFDSFSSRTFREQFQIKNKLRISVHLTPEQELERRRKLSEATKKQMRNMTEEQRLERKRKISASLHLRFQDPKIIEKMKQSAKRRTPELEKERRRKIGEASIQSNKLTKEIRSVKMRKRWQDPEYQAKMLPIIRSNNAKRFG